MLKGSNSAGMSPSSSVTGIVFDNGALVENLPTADYVVIAAPYTPETESMLRADAIATMKSSAYLINVGRGQVVTESALIAALDGKGIEILLIGCGQSFSPPPKGLRQAIKAAGMALEWMDTGAACRTYNVLQLEDRPAAAALIAVE